MEATRPRLGRGLTALINETATMTSTGSSESATIARLPVGRIQPNPYQPRKEFDADELRSLTESVRTHGVLQPLVVREREGEYELIAGERRLRAAQAAGLAEVPVHIVRFDDQQVFEAALIENIQRSDLNPIEKAQGFRDYLDRFGLTQEQLGARLGLDRSTVSNLLGLLNLPAEVQDAVRLGQITLGHAKVIKGVSDPAQQVALCKETVLRNYSVHALELLVKQRKQGLSAISDEHSEPDRGGSQRHAETSSSEGLEKTSHVLALETELKRRLAVKAEIRLKASDRGQVILPFENTEDFERIVHALIPHA